MFDANQFKRNVKEWIRLHPEGTEAELQDFCEDQIPPANYTANLWLVEHTLSWYRHILSQRHPENAAYDEADEATLS